MANYYACCNVIRCWLYNYMSSEDFYGKYAIFTCNNQFYILNKLVRQECDKSLTCFDAMTGTFMWTHQKDTFQFRTNHGIGYVCWEKGIYICSLRKITSSGGYFTKWMQHNKVLLNRNYSLKEVTSITMDRGKILLCLQWIWRFSVFVSIDKNVR